jgi:hypothetical protein
LEHHTSILTKGIDLQYRKRWETKNYVKHYEITAMKKRGNKSDGEQTYLITGRVSLTDLASWQEEGGDHRGVVWVTAEWGGGRKIKME